MIRRTHTWSANNDEGRAELQHTTLSFVDATHTYTMPDSSSSSSSTPPPSSEPEPNHKRALDDVWTSTEPHIAKRVATESAPSILLHSDDDTRVRVLPEAMRSAQSMEHIKQDTNAEFAQFQQWQAQNSAAAKLSASEAARATLKDEHTTLKDEHTTLKDEHTTLKDEHDTLKDEHDTLKDKHATLKGELDDALNESSAMSKLAYTLEGKSNTRSDALTDMTADRDALRLLIRTLASSFNEKLQQTLKDIDAPPLSPLSPASAAASPPTSQASPTPKKPAAKPKPKPKPKPERKECEGAALAEHGFAQVACKFSDFSLKKVEKHEETCDAYRIYKTIMDKKGEAQKKARKPQQCSKCDSYDHNASWHKSGGGRP